MKYRLLSVLSSLFFLFPLMGYPPNMQRIHNLYGSINREPTFNGESYRKNGYTNAYEQSAAIAMQGNIARIFALQADAAIFIRDRSNPSKFFLTLQNVNPDVIYYASRTIAGRTSLKAFLQDVDWKEKGKIISSFSSKIQQQAFEPSENVTLTLSNLKWYPKERTITVDALSSQQNQLAEGTYVRPLFFVRLNEK